MTFNQVTKNLLSVRLPRHTVVTVHEAIGRTFSNCVLYVDDFAYTTQITKSERHVIVALTRHTESILIAGSHDGLSRTLYHVNSQLELNTSLFNIHHSQVDYVYDKSKPDLKAYTD